MKVFVRGLRTEKLLGDWYRRVLLNAHMKNFCLDVLEKRNARLEAERIQKEKKAEMWSHIGTFLYRVVLLKSL